MIPVARFRRRSATGLRLLDHASLDKRHRRRRECRDGHGPRGNRRDAPGPRRTPAPRGAPYEARTKKDPAKRHATAATVEENTAVKAAAPTTAARATNAAAIASGERLNFHRKSLSSIAASRVRARLFSPSP